jgi:putative transcriptional regulator
LAGKATPGPPGPEEEDEVLRGRLLVAMPAVHEETFARTVILLLEHGPDGAVGVVVNRPSDLDLHGTVPGWWTAAAAPAVVFVGGPVGQGGAICLGRATTGAVEGWEPVAGEVGLVDLDRAASEVLQGVDQLRVFTGYAGWGPGQLEDELEAGAWLVCDHEPGDALSPEPGSLWRRVLRRQPGKLSWLANVPDHPSLN